MRSEKLHAYYAGIAGARKSGKRRQKANFLPARFETFEEAKDRRATAKRALRRGNKPARQVRKSLAGCRKGCRCEAESCAVCLRRYRRNLFRAALPILKSRPHWTAASVIPAGLAIPYGTLNQIDVVKLVASFRRRLQRSLVLRHRLVFGAIDISLNLQNNTIQHWQLHLYLLIEGKKNRKLKNAVKAAFPKEPTAPCPYHFKKVTDFPEAASYVYKSVFNRRSGYRKNGAPRTWPLPLKPADLRELLPFLDRIPLGGRLLLHGLRRNGNPLRLQPTSRKKAAKKKGKRRR